VGTKRRLLVELGVLLDVFVACSSWGSRSSTSREFDSIDTTRLETLRY